MRHLVLAAAAAAAVTLLACAADPPPSDVPPMTFAYGCARAEECPIEQPTMLASVASVSMIVHGEPDGAAYALRAADKTTIAISAHTSRCECRADDLARERGGCPEGKANVCAHRFIVEGLAVGDTTVEVLDGERVVASTPLKVRRAATVDVTITPAESASRASDGAYEVKAGAKVNVIPHPLDADGVPLRYSGASVSFAFPDQGVVAHDATEPGPVAVARAVAPGAGAITVVSGDARRDVAVRVLAP